MTLSGTTRGEKDDLFTLEDVLLLLGVCIKPEIPDNIAKLGAYLTGLPLAYVRKCLSGDSEDMADRIVWTHALWDFAATAIWQQVVAQNRAAAVVGIVNATTGKPEMMAVRDAVDTKRLDRHQPLLLAPLDEKTRDALAEALLSEDYHTEKMAAARHKLMRILDDDEDTMQ
ncbi:MAG: hypothetical protein EON60_06810 [Alphaproteobacteria bacterium]|nr:MAG: hypothetical protein EON60_06810 [Alphaproteobacteria bacterium]